MKFKSEPWITLGLQKSISVKNKLLTNFINKKDPILKEEFHTKYKKYRNLLSTFKLWHPSRICSRTPSIFTIYKLT